MEDERGAGLTSGQVTDDVRGETGAETACEKLYGPESILCRPYVVSSGGADTHPDPFGGSAETREGSRPKEERSGSIDMSPDVV